ncbi:uncharacterized protein EAE97_011634 [Botrytis byssoidea]|uniref:Uncharacterized protein n=1 Tax=Botrytis byssoidea TaxID=139641 RepID=A0A9P5HQC7_9HELO|nr:uncharacterized protein EAE97_011634 [Botrytis byssoidea]KAF7919716.1 hypothetical protein EAE97_011634 [Botrytis byssoidea]
MTLNSTRSQKGKQVVTGATKMQTAQGTINNKNNARSRKGKKVDANTTPSESVQDNEGAAKDLQMQDVFGKIHQLASDLKNLRQGVAKLLVEVFGNERVESLLNDLSKIKVAVDTGDTTFHAIVNLMQLMIDELQDGIDEAKFMIVGNSSNGFEEEGEKDFEDDYIINSSAGSDIPAVPKGLQQPPQKQVDQSQTSVVEPSAVADVANPLLPRKAVKLSAQKIDFNRRPSVRVALGNAATSSSAGSLRRSKRSHDTTNLEREDKHQRRS